MIQLEATMTSDIVPWCQKLQGIHVEGICIHGTVNLICFYSPSPKIISTADITNDELCQTAQLLCQTLWNLSRESHERPQSDNSPSKLLILFKLFPSWVSVFIFPLCTNSVTIFSVTNQGHYEAALSSSPLYCPHHEPSPGPGGQ